MAEESREKTLTFAELLRELRDTTSALTASELAGLSGMTPDELSQFKSAWPEIDSGRRLAMVQELLDLEEDNVEFDFDAIFIEGLHDEDAEVRLASVRGLWEHEAVDLIPQLAKLTEDSDPGVRAEASLALGRFVMLFETGRLRERHFAAVEEALRAVVTRSGEIDEVRARALEAIGPRDDAWVRQAISEAYESGVRRLKVAAVHAMGRSCESRWLPLLLRELGNEEAEVRYEAANALGSLGVAGAVGHLIQALNDTDEEVRAASIAALGEIGGRDAREALLTLTREGSPAAKEAAAEALAEIDFAEDPLSFRQRF
jgi:HEAT repeat protein